MAPEIRIGPSTDAARYLATDQLVWFEERPDAPPERLMVGVPEDQRFAVEVPGCVPATYAAIYGVRPMTLSVPGPDLPRQVPVAGLTWVGVHPDQRRRGLLTAMLRHHFEQTHDAGVALSALHASEPTIYGRHGYGLASLETAITLGRGTVLRAPHLEEEAGRISTRWGAVTDAGMPTRLHVSDLRAAATSPGSIVGALGYYTGLCDEFPEQLRGKEPRQVLFAVLDGADVGHAIFRREQKWDHDRPGGQVSVSRLTGSPAARLALTRRLVDIDLTATVEIFNRGLDDELLHWINGPRGAAAVHSGDSLWVRLVDLPAALAQRTYAAPCDVVLEVADEPCPWNAGRWRIVVDDSGAAEVTRTDRDAEVELEVRLLGAAYLGASNLVTMHRAGLLAELRPGAVVELWRSMRAEVTPAGAIGF